MEISFKKIQEGDQLAFKELFDEFYQTLCVFATHYLRDNALAADVAQEAFLKYWNQRADFDNYFKVRSFLYIVVRNSCLNILRESNRRIYTEPLKNVELEALFNDAVIEEESHRIFYKAIASLPRQMKQIIHFTLEGKEISEIAVELGVTESNVYKLKTLAYKKLRKLMKDHYYLIFLWLFFFSK